MNSRAIAAQIIFEVITERRSLNDALSKYIHNNTDDAPYIKELSFGTMRWYFQLNTYAHDLLYKPLKPKDAIVTCILLLSLYQIFHTDTPDYAIVDSAIKAIKSLKKEWAAGLINKILRRAIQERAKLIHEHRNEIEVTSAHPRWLAELIEAAYPDSFETIFAANNHRPPMFLRVNRQQTTREDYLKQLEQKGLFGEPIKAAPDGIRLIEPQPVNNLPNFSEGYCSVQDIAGQHVIELLELAPKLNVLDACAAPGSKTCHLLEREPNLNKVVAIDKDSERLQMIKENLDRLKLNDPNKIQLHTADTNDTNTWWDKTLFDRILIDAPCSATGVIRRHPDIKYLRQLDDIKALQSQQLKLLNNCWPLRAPKGILVYTTCSILPQENQEMIDQFVEAHRDEIENVTTQQQLPEENGGDGFFYAQIVSKEREINR